MLIERDAAPVARPNLDRYSRPLAAGKRVEGVFCRALWFMLCFTWNIGGRDLLFVVSLVETVCGACDVSRETLGARGVLGLPVYT